MTKHNCEKCKFRGKYDADSKSFLGRIWKWHIGFCPGFNGYMKSLSEDDRKRLADQYDLVKYK